MTINLTKPGEPTLASVRALLASHPDTRDCQLRVTTEGVAYLSDVTGAEELDGILFRLETWDSLNRCFGPEGAADEAWVSRVLQVLKDNWPTPKSKYIDSY